MHHLLRSGAWLVLAIALLIGGCSPSGDVAAELRVGVLATLQGDFAVTSGRPTLEAAQMAVDEINMGGGLELTPGGRRVRVTLVVKDFEDRAEAATAAARALVNQDGIHVLIGPQLSRHAIPVAVVAEDAGLPMISPMASNPEVTAGKRWVFRLAASDNAQGDAIARTARDDLGARSAAVLYDVANPYSRGLAGLFQAAFTAAGGTVVAVETYTTDQAAAGFESQLLRIRAARPDVLLLPNSSSVVTVQLRSARALGVTATLLGSDTWDARVIGAVREAEGAYVSHQWNPSIDAPVSQAFVEAFVRRYGETPKATAALTYDAFQVIWGAVRRAQSLELERIRDGIAATERFAGASGDIGFRSSGDPVRAVFVSRIEDGALQLHRIVEPRER